MEGKWELKMSEARKLRKLGAEALHQRVSLLVDCYNDLEFRKFCEQNQINDIDYLDAELEDTAANFLTLMSVLKTYPSVEDWSKHNIRDLIAEAIELQRKPKDTAHRPSWKARALAAEEECERLRGEVVALQKALELSQTTMQVGSQKPKPNNDAVSVGSRFNRQTNQTTMQANEHSRPGRVAVTKQTEQRCKFSQQ